MRIDVHLNIHFGFIKNVKTRHSSLDIHRDLSCLQLKNIIMLKYHLFVLIFVAMVCLSSSWRVFPLPNQPAQIVSTSSVYTTSRTIPFATVKTPVSQTTPSPTENILPARFLKPVSIDPIKVVKEPSKDLLPPKVRVIVL